MSTKLNISYLQLILNQLKVKFKMFFCFFLLIYSLASLLLCLVNSVNRKFLAVNSNSFVKLIVVSTLRSNCRKKAFSCTINKIHLEYKNSSKGDYEN